MVTGLKLISKRKTFQLGLFLWCLCKSTRPFVWLIHVKYAIRLTLSWLNDLGPLEAKDSLPELWAGRLPIYRPGSLLYLSAAERSPWAPLQRGVCVLGHGHSYK